MEIELDSPRAWGRQTTPDEDGAMCEAVVLCLKLAGEQEDDTMDEVCCAWLRLRRSARELSLQQHNEARYPSGKWLPEDKPPTEEDLELSDHFHTSVLNRTSSLEDAFDGLTCGAGELTLFALRSRFGVLGKQDSNSRLLTINSSGGSIWPGDLAAPEKMFNTLCVLLRASGGVPRDKFLQLKSFIEKEREIKKFMTSNDLLDLFVSELSGARLRSIVSFGSQPYGSSEKVMEILHYVELLLELEPKSCANRLLLSPGEGMLGIIIDMVIRQGVECIINESVLRLWSLCLKIVQQAISLRCPRTAKLTPVPSATATPRGYTVGKGVVADVHTLRMARSFSDGSLRNKNPDNRPRPDSPGGKANTITNSSGTIIPALQNSLQMLESSPSLAVSKDSVKSDVAAAAAEKIVVRRGNLKSRKTLPTPGSPSSSSSAKNLLPLVAEESKGGASPSVGRLKGLVRRATIQTPTVPDVEQLKGKSNEVPDKEWEINCCAMLWTVMPAQSITYAIGVSLHAAGKNARLLKVLRAAWALLDQGSALECTLGNIGTLRLRMQMDLLADQFTDCMNMSAFDDEEDRKRFVDKARLTLLRLRNMSEGDSRFGQVLVLYGVAFIAEKMCAWSLQTPDGEAMTTAARELTQTLSPFLKQLFEKRKDM